jgi:hypothetical protein
MPLEWLHILSFKDIDKPSTLHDLKYKYTVGDVYDMLEVLDIDNMYASEEERVRKNATNN